MCLAEVGEDPANVDAAGDGGFYFAGTPNEVAWRAVQLAKMGTGERQFCFACSLAAAYLDGERWEAVTDACRAYLPLTEDCGIDRPSSSTGDSGR